MATGYDVIVLGCGAMGAATVWRLACRGAATLGLDQFEAGHDRGSSHGHSRVIRQAYFEHPDYVPLLAETYRLFAELERVSGQTLLVRTGAVFAGRPHSEVVIGTELAAARHRIPVERLDPTQARFRFPGLRLADDHVAILEPGAGFVRPEATIRACQRAAIAAGATIRTGSAAEVLSWRAEAAGVVVETRGLGQFRADQLVITAGAWAPRLLAGLGVPLTVTRQPLLWSHAAEPALREAHAAPQLPVWLVDRHDGSAVYGIPEHPILDGPAGMKVAIHGRGQTTDPDSVDRTVAEGEQAAIRAAVEEVVPGSTNVVTGTAVCLYTWSPDGHFIIDRWPGAPRVAFATGFSGHGFKFAPVIGEALAAGLCDGRASPWAAAIEFLALERFRGPLPGRSAAGQTG